MSATDVTFAWIEICGLISLKGTASRRGWLRHYVTNRKVAVSIPGEVIS
jgi:hypothetical protein